MCRHHVDSMLDRIMGLSLTFTWAARKTTGTHAAGAWADPKSPAVAHPDPNWRSPARRRSGDGDLGCASRRSARGSLDSPSAAYASNTFERAVNLGLAMRDVLARRYRVFHRLEA